MQHDPPAPPLVREGWWLTGRSGCRVGIRPGVLGKDQRRFVRMMRVSIAEETGETHRSLLSSMPGFPFCLRRMAPLYTLGRQAHETFFVAQSSSSRGTIGDFRAPRSPSQAPRTPACPPRQPELRTVLHRENWPRCRYRRLPWADRGTGVCVAHTDRHHAGPVPRSRGHHRPRRTGYLRSGGRDSDRGVSVPLAHWTAGTSRPQLPRRLCQP